VAQIDAYRSNGSFVTKADAEGVGVIRRKATESDTRENVAAIIKGGKSNPFLMGNGIRNSEFTMKSSRPPVGA